MKLRNLVPFPAQKTLRQGEPCAEPARVLAFPDPDPPDVRRARQRLLAMIVATDVSDAGVDAILAICKAEHIKLPH